MFDAAIRVFAHLLRWNSPALILGVALGAHVAPARDPAPLLAPLLSSGTTVVGEPVIYPSGAAKITAVIATFPPGGETGWHTHRAPVFGYILAGEITVDYGAKGTRVYRAGDSVLEAVDVAHNGRNMGTEPVRMLAVFMGVEGSPLSSPASPPK